MARPSSTTSPDIELSSLGLLRLLQLSSPSLPIGAFAYSRGLEPAVEAGFVKDATSLGTWLTGSLIGVLAETDLPLLREARAALGDSASSAFDRASALAVALRETSELRAEERQTGIALARVLVTLGVEAAAPYVLPERASYVALFALGAHHFHVSVTAMLHAYAYAWAEHQVVSATRLISLGQNDAQRTLSHVIQHIPEAVERAQCVPVEAIGRSAFGVALASSWHEEQYSRLFRS